MVLMIVLVAVTKAGTLTFKPRVARIGGARPTAALPDGEVGAIAGRAVLAEAAAILGPDRTPCVFLRMRCDEVGVEAVERGRAQWFVPFLIETPDGRARVIPDARMVIVLPARTYTVPRSGAPASIPPEVAAFGYQHTALFAYPSTAMVVRVELVAVGAPVAVRAACHREPDPDAQAAVTGYREALPTRPVLAGSRFRRLVLGLP